MTPVVLIPWRKQPERSASLDVVLARLTATFPGIEPALVDAPPGPFSRGAAITNAINEHCTQSSLAVVCDADSLIEPEALRDAVIVAAFLGRLVLPYTRYRGLGEEATAQVLADPSMAEMVPAEDEGCWSTGGAMAIPARAFWRAGGFDPRFVGWGFEDTAFRVACDTLLGPTLRITGSLTHLWHPLAPREPAEYDGNSLLSQRYERASGDPDAVQALIAERAS